MKNNRFSLAVLSLSLLYSGCKNQTNKAKVKVDGEEFGEFGRTIACDLGHAWWLTLSSMTAFFGPVGMLAGGAIAASANGILQRSPTCNHEKDKPRQSSLTDIAVILRDQLDDKSIEESTLDLNTMIDAMAHYNKGVGGDNRDDLSVWKTKTQTALIRFHDAGLMTLPLWVEATALRLQILKVRMQRNIELKSPADTIRTDAQNIVRAVDGAYPYNDALAFGIERKIENMRAQIVTRSSTFYNKDFRTEKLNFEEVAGFTYRYCRDPKAFSETEKGYLSVFDKENRKSDIPLSMVMRATIIEQGPICSDNASCADENECKEQVNAALALREAEFVKTMTADFIDRGDQIKWLLEESQKLKAVAQDVISQNRFTGLDKSGN